MQFWYFTIFHKKINDVFNGIDFMLVKKNKYNTYMYIIKKNKYIIYILYTSFFIAFCLKIHIK